jgi:hypothetical protein
MQTMCHVGFPKNASTVDNTTVGHAMPHQGMAKSQTHTPYIPIHQLLVMPAEDVYKSDIGVSRALSNEVDVLFYSVMGISIQAVS